MSRRARQRKVEVLLQGHELSLSFSQLFFGLADLAIDQLPLFMLLFEILFLLLGGSFLLRVVDRGRCHTLDWGH